MPLGYPLAHLGGSLLPHGRVRVKRSIGTSAVSLEKPRGLGRCLQGRGIRAREKTCNVLSLIRLLGFLLLRGARCLL